MQDSIKRVSALLNGELPDRVPLFDLLRNDAVIEHFSGRELTAENAREAVYQAYAPAIDATRPLVRMPAPESSVILADGRQQLNRRWTSWTEHQVYPDSAAYAATKRRDLAAADPAAWTPSRQLALEQALGRIGEERRQLGEVFFVPGLAGPGLMGIDGLNPIEVLAGMDIAAIHRRHPQLFMAGGIDVSQLLPFGSPQEVRDAVKKAIDDAGSRIMVGSSTELNDEVPLANFLALREAVFASPY